MINYLSLLGACALTAFSAPIQHKNKPIQNDIVVSDTSYAITWRYSTDTYFMNWFNGLGTTSSNTMCMLHYYDIQGNSYMPYGSTFSSNSFSTALQLFYEYSIEDIDGNVSIGVLDIFRYNNANSMDWYRLFVCNSENGGKYYLTGTNDSSSDTIMAYTIQYDWDNDLWISYDYAYFTLTYDSNAYSISQNIYNKNYQLDEYAYHCVTSYGVKYYPIPSMVFHSNRSKYSFEHYFIDYTQTVEFNRWSTDYTYEQGYNDGYNAGNASGSSSGYQDGYTAGYNEGASQDSTALTIFTGIINVALVPVNFFLQILNFEVFGINIAGLVTSFMTIAIVMFFWRMFAGGKNDD